MIARLKMKGRISQRKSNVKNRLGKKNLQTGKIRDARDVLRKKVSTKSDVSRPKVSNVMLSSGRPKSINSENTKARIRRLMPLQHLIDGEHGKSSNRSTKNLRSLSLSNDSIRITTKQPELSRKAIVSSSTLKIITPSSHISQGDSSSDSPPRRTLTNDLYTSTLSRLTDQEDLRTSSPNLSFKSLNEERPSLIQRSTKTKNEHKNLRKIIVTNLHSRVTQADIVELFGAIGSLVNVKLENNVAEIVFESALDADKAYHKYHNRMLDGQAMKCSLTMVIPHSDKSNPGASGIKYSGVELVYPSTSSRPVVFQVRI